MSKVLSPQRKEELSYERDRRNVYGESSKGSRKSIPRHKKAVIKSYRRNAKQLLAQGSVLLDSNLAEAADSKITAVKKKRWRKAPDAPLRQVVPSKIQGRIACRRGRKNRRV